MQELEADLGIPKTTVSEILMRDLCMKHVVAKFIPGQKEHGATVASDLVQTTTNESDFLKKVITGDELWVYGYDLKMKAQSSQ